MDPLSIASGIGGLITLADLVISRTYNTIIACKNASEDSRKLLREVQTLPGILPSLATLESKSGASALCAHISAAQVYSTVKKHYKKVRDKLEKADPKEQGIAFVQKAKRTLRWPLSSSDIEDFLVEMERHKLASDLVYRRLLSMPYWHLIQAESALGVQQLCEAVSIEVGTASLDVKRLVDAQEILINCSSLVRLSASKQC